MKGTSRCAKSHLHNFGVGCGVENDAIGPLRVPKLSLSRPSVFTIVYFDSDSLEQ